MFTTSNRTRHQTAYLLTASNFTFTPNLLLIQLFLSGQYEGERAQGNHRRDPRRKVNLQRDCQPSGQIATTPCASTKDPFSILVKRASDRKHADSEPGRTSTWIDDLAHHFGTQHWPVIFKASLLHHDCCFKKEICWAGYMINLVVVVTGASCLNREIVGSVTALTTAYPPCHPLAVNSRAFFTGTITTAAKLSSDDRAENHSGGTALDLGTQPWPSSKLFRFTTITMTTTHTLSMLQSPISTWKHAYRRYLSPKHLKGGRNATRSTSICHPVNFDNITCFPCSA